jgi:hypothetical protein
VKLISEKISATMPVDKHKNGRNEGVLSEEIFNRIGIYHLK